MAAATSVHSSGTAGQAETIEGKMRGIVLETEGAFDAFDGGHFTWLD